MKFLPLIVGLVMAAALAGRLGWTALRQETGKESLVGLWRQATWGRAWGHEPPVTHQSPAEQADFWLLEVDRVLSQQPPSAGLSMGAAWILDQPSRSYLRDHIAENQRACPLLPQPNLEALYGHAWNRKEQTEFQSRCRQRCLELAATATGLEPSNPRWWRMRARLQFQFDERDTLVPGDDWQAVLEEAARHDPDNALYDYLTALARWEASSNTVHDQANDIHNIRVFNWEDFARGTEAFERGQQKSSLSCGGSEAQLVSEFLQDTKLPYPERIELAWRLRNAQWELDLLWLLNGWAEWTYGSHHQASAGAAGHLRRWQGVIRLLEQAQSSELSSTHIRSRDQMRRKAVDKVSQLFIDNPDLDSRAITRTVDSQVALTSVVGQLALPAPPWSQPTFFSSISLTSLIARIALWTSTTLLFIAVPGLLTGWLLARGKQDVALGKTRHAIAWSVPYSLSWALLGAAPAKLISPAVLFAGLCAAAIVVALLLLWSTWKLLRLAAVWARDKSSAARRLAATVIRIALGAAAGFLPILPMVLGREGVVLQKLRDDLFVQFDLSTLPPRATVSEQGWSIYYVGELARAMNAVSQPVRYAMLQWLAYGCLNVVPLVALGWVAAWYTLRWARAKQALPPDRWSAGAREYVGGVVCCVGRSALSAALILLLVHLAIAPAVLDEVERDYQSRTALLKESDQTLNRAAQLIEKLRATPAAKPEELEELESLLHKLPY